MFNNKTIFVITIEVYPHQEPASRRGTPESIVISEQEIAETLARASSTEAK